MAELKTLKDLENDWEPIFDHAKDEIDYKTLRQEAIKWIKSKELDCHEGDHHTKEWIKHFFNITEEDLK